MSRKKAGQVEATGKKPKRRLRKLLFLAALGGLGAAVSKKLSGSGGPSGTVPVPPPAPPHPTPTAAPTAPPVAEAPAEAPVEAPAETPAPTDLAGEAEAAAPAETPAEPADLAAEPETPAVPADSLTSFFDEVLTETQEKKRARKD
jgi:hypothetical protein